jgi:hypothetical protein
MGTRDTYHRTLLTACNIMGDEAALAQALQLPVEEVVNYLVGDVPVPVQVFAEAINIVIRENNWYIADAGLLLEQIRTRNKLPRKP